MGVNLPIMHESLAVIKRQTIDVVFHAMNAVSEQQEFTSDHHLNMQIPGIKERFIEQQDECFNTLIKPASPTRHNLFAPIKRTMHDLALVEYEDLNFQLLRRKFSDKIYDVLGADLALATLRFEELLGHELELDDMPLSPVKLSKSLQSAIKPIEVDAEKKEAFFRHTLTCFAKNYRQCVNQANNTFIEKGILTDLNDSDGRAYYMRKQKQFMSKNKRNELMASISEETLLDEKGKFVDTKMDDLLNTIDIPQQEHQHIVEAAPLAPAANQQQLLHAISELQGNLSQSNADGYLSPKNHLSLAKQLENETSLKDYGLNKSDSNSIGMMSMLFDNLLNNAHIASPIKALLEQLQAPLLRSALLDKNFFADTGNPAQALVDTITEQGAGWSADKDPSKDFLYKKMADIVATVNNDFDDSYDVFDDALNDFSQFNKSHQARVTKLEKRIVSAEKSKARFNRAKDTAREHNQKAFSDYVLGDEMTDFFDQHWQLVLFYIHNKYDNQNNKEWRKAINTENLLKLNLAGSDKADKRKTVAALQKMMLDTGQQKIDVNAGLQKIIPFIKHTSRVSEQADNTKIATSDTGKSTVRALHEAARSVAAQITAPSAMEAAPAVNARRNKAVDSAPEQPIEEQTQALEPEQLKQLQEQLTVGSWLAESTGDSTEKVKVAAYIKHTDTFILIRRNGSKFGSFNSSQMSHRLMQKTLILLESSMMFDRALESVIQSIRAA
ncbi:MAG: DUF1631 family protein [Pseudomonadales bacterium]|nr:DUF1631 family protein [Pseudomonadales bacterium]